MPIDSTATRSTWMVDYEATTLARTTFELGQAIQTMGSFRHRSGLRILVDTFSKSPRKQVKEHAWQACCINTPQSWDKVLAPLAPAAAASPSKSRDVAAKLRVVEYWLKGLLDADQYLGEPALNFAECNGALAETQRLTHDLLAEPQAQRHPRQVKAVSASLAEVLRRSKKPFVKDR